MTPQQLDREYRHALKGLVRIRAAAMRGHDPTVEFLVEAIVRIEQQTYILKRFRRLDLEQRRKFRALPQLGASDPQGHRRRARAVHGYGDRLALYAEMFYYVAARAGKVLQKTSQFRTFEAIGVRRVRDWLVEHADHPTRGVMNRNYTYDCPQGIILKPFGGGPQRGWMDKGLYPNAEEFITALRKIL
jgi:hypothetical protein